MKRILFLLIAFVVISNIKSQNEYIVKTNNKIKNEKESVYSEEEQFVLDNFPFHPIRDWYKGMKFMAIRDDNVLSAGNPPNLKSLTGTQLSKLQYHILTVDTIYEVEGFSNYLKQKYYDSYIRFKSDTGDKFEFCYHGQLSDTDNDEVSIDDLAYLNDVDIAKQLLMNKEIYICLNYGNIESDSDAEYLISPPERIKIDKFSKVKIVKIGVGDSNHCPVKIIFRDAANKEYFLNIAFSMTNGNDNFTSGYIDADGKFADVFSFHNPRYKNKDISDKHWNLIKKGQICIGMKKRLVYCHGESLIKLIKQQ